MSQHLPLRAVARPARRKCMFSPSSRSRPFSTTFARRKANQADEENPKTAETMRQEAIQTLSPEALEDIGLLPGTFVRAWGATPSLIPKPLTPLSLDRYKSALATRLQFEWRYVKARLSDLFQMAWYKWWLRRTPLKEKPKQVFFHGIVKRLAQQRYIELYENLAAGTVQPLQGKFSESLITHLRDRIASRPPQQKQSWKLHKFNSDLRVVSNRMTILPYGNEDDRTHPYAIRQVVVRIPARQQLTITHPDDENPASRSRSRVGRRRNKNKKLAWSPDSAGTPLPSTSQDSFDLEQGANDAEEVELQNTITKDSVEYLVMQMPMRHGVERDWTALGFTEATTPERIREMDEYKKQELEYNAQRFAKS